MFSIVASTPKKQQRSSIILRLEGCGRTVATFYPRLATSTINEHNAVAKRQCGRSRVPGAPGLSPPVKLGSSESLLPTTSSTGGAPRYRSRLSSAVAGARFGLRRSSASHPPSGTHHQQPDTEWPPDLWASTAVADHTLHVCGKSRLSTQHLDREIMLS